MYNDAVISQVQLIHSPDKHAVRQDIGPY